MVSPTKVTFGNDYVPDEGSLVAVAAALERPEPIEVQWPERTAKLLEETDERRAAGSIPAAPLLGHNDARREATAPERLPRLWRALASAGAMPEDARRALSTFLRFANLRILRGLAHTLLQGQTQIEAVFGPRTPEYELYNSKTGQRALGVSEPIYSVDVDHPQRRRAANVDVFAPMSLVDGLGSGDPITGELLVVWTIPQHELPQPPQIAGDDMEVEYGGGIPTVLKIRDENFREL